MEEDDATLLERERKYQEWSRKKDIRDKAVSLLGGLNPDRANTRASLREVGVALAAVDMILLGTDGDITPDRLAKQEKRQAVAKEKNMRSYFSKFTMENHSFLDVKINEQEYNQFSGAIQELIQDPEVNKETGAKEYSLMSLKYNFPAVAKPGVQAKGLTGDQKLQNSIFNREVRRIWKEIREDMCARVANFQASGGKMSSLATTIVDEDIGFSLLGGGESKDTGGGSDAKEAGGRDSKSGGGGGAESKGGDRAGADDKGDGAVAEAKDGGAEANKTSSNISPERLASRALAELSIRRLKKFIEEDDDAALQAKKEKDREDRQLAKEAHQQFVRKKDSLRIRLPPQELVDKVRPKGDGGGRMGFGGAMASRRQVTAGAKSTVDLMLKSGLKYVHATKKGRSGADGDLETCRRELIKMGFVAKENFDHNDDSEEDEENPFGKRALREARAANEERREMEKKEKEDRAKSFQAWATQKDMRAQAARLLRLIKAPIMADTGSSQMSGARGHETEEGVVLCLDVGKALKKVDVRLIDDWASWCEGIISFNTCFVLWDYFTPVKPSRIRFEEAEEKKRAGICRRYGVTFTPQEHREKQESKGESKGGDDYEDDYEDAEDDRRDGIRFLLEQTRDARQEEILKEMLSTGEAPKPPTLTCAGPSDSMLAETASGCDELVLRWELAPGSLVSFFSLEMAEGAVGSGKAEHKYREIYRDPKDASPGSVFELYHRVVCLPGGASLQPSTTYSFRIRAMNGFGAGEFSYSQFTTRPTAPAPPRIIKLASDSVTLQWVFSASFFRALEQLKNLFELADRDHSGQISRDELLDVITEARTPEVKQLIAKAQKAVGATARDGFDALFDQLESDDDEMISWEEFERFFMNAGWTAGTGGSVTGSMAASVSASMSASKNNTAKMTYVLEQCEDEFSNKYVAAVKTGSGQATISRLIPGKSYRFRVYAINTSGARGPPSGNIIVHTMLETPAVPLVTKGGVQARKVTLQWRGRRADQSTRDPRVVKQMFGQWTGAGADEEGAVSVEAAFARYDKDMSGFIDASELAYMLDDLGVDVTEERLREAFEMLDTDGNGVISFDEFSSWWARDDVLYTIKRSDSIDPSLPTGLIAATTKTGMAGSASLASVRSSAAAGRTSASIAAAPTKIKNFPMPFVSFRGKETRCEIAGLEPNHLYHFKQRFVGPRSDSALSNPLVLMTAPSRTSRPVLIRLTNNMAWVKWYPGKAGAFKFVIQAMWDGGGGDGSGDGKSWTMLFNGKENTWKSTTLQPGTEYTVRVVALNEQGAASEPSEPLVFVTRPRSDSKPQLTAKNADRTFTVECTGDVCVGDTILITERLYTKSRSGAADDVPGNGLGKSTGKGARMNMSVTSLGGGAAEPAAGTYIGEYTMAAHVVRDNHRKIRDDPAMAVGSTKFARRRLVGLEVVWQRGSNKACDDYALQTGAVVERRQEDLEKFEVFRCPWIDEAHRINLAGEWAMLEECFVTNPHCTAV